MAGQAIYLPQTPSFGEALGQGLGGGVSSFVTKEIELQQKRQDFQHRLAGLEAIKNAGSREKALDIFVSGVIPFQSMEEMNNARQVLDQIWPPKDTTQHKVSLYDKEGNPTDRYVQAGQLSMVNSPQGIEQLFGKDSGLSPTKPDPKVTFYTADDKDNFIAGRRAPLGSRQQGEYTLEEINAKMKVRSDARSATAAERSAKAAEESTKRESRNADTQAMNTELNIAKAGQIALAQAMNLKHTVGLDGVSIDFEGDREKAAAYGKALPLLNKTIKANKGDVGQAITQIVDQIGYKPREAEPAPEIKASPKEPGFIEKSYNLLTGKKTDSKKEAKVEDAPTDQTKREKNKVYNTPAKGPMKWTGTGWVKP